MSNPFDSDRLDADHREPARPPAESLISPLEQQALESVESILSGATLVEVRAARNPISAADEQALQHMDELAAAVVEAANGQVDDALRRGRIAAEALSGTPRRRIAAFRDVAMAHLFELNGEVASAVDHSQALLDLLLSGPPSPVAIGACHEQLGRLTLATGDLKSAKAHLTAATTIESAHPHAALVRASAHRMLVLLALDDPLSPPHEAATHARQAAYAEPDERSDQTDQAEMLDAMTNGLPGEAEALAAAWLASGDEARARRACWVLAQLATDRGDWPAAAEHLDQLRTIAAVSSDPELLCSVETSLSEVRLAGGDVESARRHAQRAHDLLPRDRSDQLAALVALARAEAATENADPAVALAHALEAIRLRGWMRRHQQLKERPTISDPSIFDLDTLALGLAVAAGDGRAGFEIMQHARATDIGQLLAHRIDENAYDGDTLGVADLVHRLHASVRASADIVGQLATDPTDDVLARIELQLRRRAVDAVTDDLRRQLGRKLGARARAVLAEAPDTVDLPDLAPDHHVLFLYAVSDAADFARVYRVWLRAGHEPELDFAPLNESDASVLSVLTSDVPREYPLGQARIDLMGDADERGWHELAEVMLPAPLRSSLVRRRYEPGDPPTVTLIPFHHLWRFPFAALVLDRLHDVRVVDCAAVNLLPSLTFAQHRRAKEDGAERPPALAYLPVLHLPEWAESERTALKATFDVTEATTAAQLLNELATGRRFDLATVSTHGDAKDGLQHGLRLDVDRVLTAADLLGLQLPRHLVLGSCSSGNISSGHDEPVALSTAALLRGADVVICAALPVPDMYTAMLLSHYYRELSHETRAEHALRTAQLAVRATRPAPWFWAGMMTTNSVLLSVVRPAGC